MMQESTGRAGVGPGGVGRHRQQVAAVRAADEIDGPENLALRVRRRGRQQGLDFRRLQPGEISARADHQRYPPEVPPGLDLRRAMRGVNPAPPPGVALQRQPAAGGGESRFFAALFFVSRQVVMIGTDLVEVRSGLHAAGCCRGRRADPHPEVALHRAADLRLRQAPPDYAGVAVVAAGGIKIGGGSARVDHREIDFPLHGSAVQFQEFIDRVGGRHRLASGGGDDFIQSAPGGDPFQEQLPDCPPRRFRIRAVQFREDIPDDPQWPVRQMLADFVAQHPVAGVDHRQSGRQHFYLHQVMAHVILVAAVGSAGE